MTGFRSAGALALAFAASAGPAAAQDWTGFYIGVALGAKITDARWTTELVGDPPFPAGVLDATNPHRFVPAGLRVGGYLGYDWQVAPRWTAGIEGDFAWSNAKSALAGVPGCVILCFPDAPGPGATATTVRAKWDGSVRGRLGFVAAPALRIYGTAGVAFQRLEARLACSNTLSDPVCLVSPPFAVKSQTRGTTRVGWTLGGGLEWRLAPHWLLRGEYRYADFGAWRGAFFEGEPSVGPGSDTVRFKLRTRTHIAGIGITYAFGWR